MYVGLNTSPFPRLVADTAMRAAVADREEIRFMKQENGTVVCSYIISGPETFRDSFAREARGVVFDASGKTIARPLHKFFNVNERPETQINVLDWKKVRRVMDKRDGSMIHTVNFPSELGNYSLKSKKSFTSDVAKQATAFVKAETDRLYHAFCSTITKMNFTAIFEWTSPTARIVLAYKEPELRLLHVRNNETGEYLSRDELISLSETFYLPMVDDAALDTKNSSFDAVIDAINSGNLHQLVETVEGVEGWVFQFDDGDMVKLKTKWYMDRHHAMTFLRVRDIARMVVDESIDDLKAKLAGDGIDLSPILAIEQKVVDEIDHILQRVESVYQPNAQLSRKEFAMLMSGHQYFGLLMQKFSGKEPDVKGYFEKHLLDSMFDLTQINLTDSVAEVE